MKNAITPEGTLLALKEDSRTYIFPIGQVTLENVIEVIIRPSGSHRVRTADGKLTVVSASFLAITIVDETTKGWTV
jgi:hypothetical protein